MDYTCCPECLPKMIKYERDLLRERSEGEGDMKKISQKISRWWYGDPEYLEYEKWGWPINVVKPTPLQRYHWTALIVRWAVEEYKWIMTTIILALSVYAALKLSTSP